MRSLNPIEEIQPVNVHEGMNGQHVQRQPGNNNIIHMANDRDRAIRDYAVLTPQAIHPRIVRLDVQADNFELKPVMFQMLLMVDTSANGVLLSKSYNEAYEILEKIANNNYQWPSTRQAVTRGTASVYNIDALTVLSAQNRPAQQPRFYQQNQEQRNINNNQLSSLEALIKEFIVKNEVVVQSHAASLRNLKNQIGQLATALSNRPRGNLISNTEDPRRERKEHCKMINLRSGKDVDSLVGVPKIRVESTSIQREIFAENYDPAPGSEETITPIATDPSRAKEKQSAQPTAPQQFRHSPPFPQRFQRQQQDKQFSKILGVLKQLHINIHFVEALKQMPNYAKFFKDILTKKRRLGEFDTVALTQECSRMLQMASINLMPLSMFKQLGVSECRPTTVTLQLAGRSHAYPKGKIEDVLVKVDKFIFPVDFIVLDFEAGKEVPIILGRPFLATGKTLIDVQKGELTMRMHDQQVTFNVLDAMKSPDEIEDYRGAANITWSWDKQPFKIDKQIQQRELTPDQQEFKVNRRKVKHHMGANVNNLQKDRFLKDPG
ncbi:hypothetical protein KPL70_007791 [Citrus sinensis]|nr:hypothetical protein KPL70_007791 [Citrus sinensis]